METVVITGASEGIGRETALTFLCSYPGFRVIGIDQAPATIEHPNYTHFEQYIGGNTPLPPVPEVHYLINNAGTQDELDSIDVNLEGLIRCTEMYGLQPHIKAIVNVASTSAHNGAEFPRYAASKGGVLAYTKWTAQAIAPYGATCNSVSPGGVCTDMNAHILNQPELYKQVLDETLLGKWASASEVADWIYFIAVTNKSMTGQDIIIDNGELSKFNFVW